MEETLLFRFLNTITPISAGLNDYLFSHTSQFKFARSDQMPYIPPVSKSVYFIEQGLVAGTKLLPEGKVTQWLSNDNHFIIPGLISPIQDFIERLEFLMPTTMTGIDIGVVFDGINQFKELGLLSVSILDQHIRLMQEREYLLRLPSEVRFERAFTQHPQYFVDSNNDHLASYLRLSTRHFARLKKHYHQRGV